MDEASPALAVIERQTAVLIRNIEMLYRRTDLHDDLDRASYLLLRTLDDFGPTDINGLAAALGLDPSTAGRQVCVLKDAGLVERSPAPEDRRRSIITPTGEGLRRMETVRGRRTENLADLLAGWNEATWTRSGRCSTSTTARSRRNTSRGARTGQVSLPRSTRLRRSTDVH
jgi:DNA-binding MarR family transcriptional regulator